MTRKIKPNYTYSDVLNNLRPGSFVYPCFGYKASKVGPAWRSTNKTLEKHGLIGFRKFIRATKDKKIRHYLAQHKKDIKVAIHPTAKVFHITHEQYLVSEMWADRESIDIKHPNPLGLYLGEVLRVKEKGITKARYYVKILTLAGDVIWV